MKIPQGLLNTKAPPWAQEASSPQKVGEHPCEFHKLPLFFPGEKSSFPHGHKLLLDTEPGEHWPATEQCYIFI